jgi:hypothetical protein
MANNAEYPRLQAIHPFPHGDVAKQSGGGGESADSD